MPDVREVYEMVTKQKPPEPGALDRQQRRQVRAARNQKIGAFALAAAIGVVAIVVFAAARPNDSTVPAGEPSAAEAEAEQVTSRFLVAFGNFDAETAMTYVAHDADLTGLIDSQVPQTTEGLSLMLRLLEAQGYQQTITSCETGSVAVDVHVTCALDFHAIRSDEIGLGPFAGSTFAFTVHDGEIQRAALNWQIDEFSPQVWEPFADWVSTTYPEDVDVMYIDDKANFRLTEESIRLWEQRSREYVGVALSEEIGIAERFMEARDSHDADEALSLLAEDGARVKLLHNNRPGSYMPSGHMNRDELALALEAERIYGVRYDSVECLPSVDPIGGGEAQIECSFTMDNRLRQIAGLPPLETYFHVGVHDGRVTFLSFPWLNAGFPSNVPSESWLFIEWLQREHPEVGSPMNDGTLFHTGGQELTLNLTPEALQLLETYLDEYEAAETGT